MEILRPQSAEELAACLRDAAQAGRRIRLSGASSKDRMAGPLAEAGLAISTCAMNRVIEYEPGDLTISVQAGMLWADLTALLEKNRQMIPLDPPYHWVSTVGGVVAANCSGPRRRQYGTARDLIIGMRFATLEGRLVQSGGMVVKNVAGLDMAKLMIGSFGTLAAIASVNFKLAPMPAASRTFLLRFPTACAALGERDRILTGVLQPTAIDLLNPRAAARAGLGDAYTLLVQAAGSPAAVGRYSAELPASEALEGDAESALWTTIREFTPAFLNDHPEGAVLRLSTTLQRVGEAIDAFPAPALARAGSGVVYVYLKDAHRASLQPFKGVIEFAPEKLKASLDLWPNPGSDFPVMTRIKQLFDPKGLLNRGRLYGRI